MRESLWFPFLCGLLLLAALLPFQNCGKRADGGSSDQSSVLSYRALGCSLSAVRGDWENAADPNDTLSFTENCAGERKTCDDSFFFPDVQNRSGSFTMRIMQSNGGSCLPAGDHKCDYSLSGAGPTEVLNLTCEGQAFTYNRVTDTAPGQETKVMYVTATAVSGNLDGSGLSLLSADQICERDANRPSHIQKVKAFLSDGFTRVACDSFNCLGRGSREHKDWVLKPSTVYALPDGTVIGMTRADAGVFVFPLRTPVTGTFWTGIGSLAGNTNWVSSVYANTCSGWRQSATGQGSFGQVTLTGLTASFGACTATHPLLCVEQ